MENWEKKLKKELCDVIDKKCTDNACCSDVSCCKPKSNFPLWSIFAALLLVSGLVIGFGVYSCSSLIWDNPNRNIQNMMIWDWYNRDRSGGYDIDELRRMVEDERAKVTLLGNVSNENAMILRDMFPYDPRANSTILFGRDWRLSRMPTHLDLTPRDRSFLESWTAYNGYYGNWYGYPYRFYYNYGR